MGNDGNETPFVPTVRNVPIVPFVLFVPAVRNVPIVSFVSGVPESTPLSHRPLTGHCDSSPAGEPSVPPSNPVNFAVRRGCEQVCLTTSWPPPTGVFLPPPWGHEQRPLPVAETGSCEWRSALIFASIILDATKNQLSARGGGMERSDMTERAKPPSFWTGAQGLHQGCAGAAGRLTAGCGTARRSPPRWCRGGCRDGRRRRKRSQPGRGCPPP